MMTRGDDAVMFDDPPEADAALGKAAVCDQSTRGALHRRELLASDTEPDEDAEPEGAGPRGYG
jgi:hypothetical protein